MSSFFWLFRLWPGLFIKLLEIDMLSLKKGESDKAIRFVEVTVLIRDEPYLQRCLSLRTKMVIKILFKDTCVKSHAQSLWIKLEIHQNQTLRQKYLQNKILMMSLLLIWLLTSGTSNVIPPLLPRSLSNNHRQKIMILTKRVFSHFHNEKIRMTKKANLGYQSKKVMTRVFLKD